MDSNTKSDKIDEFLEKNKINEVNNNLKSLVFEEISENAYLKLSKICQYITKKIN